MIDFETPDRTGLAVTSFPLTAEMSQEAQQFLVKIFNKERGILILGEHAGILPDSFWEFIRQLQWPVLADPLSNIRGGAPESAQRFIVDSYDALLKHDGFRKAVEPDVIVRIGPQPVSKALALWLNSLEPALYVAVDESPMMRDPQSAVTHHIQAASDAVWTLESGGTKESHYANQWSEANRLYWEAVREHADTETDEGTLAHLLFEQSSECDLILSSSMPIRDADTFYRSAPRNVRIYANRGANGIDGVVSTAFGVQAANRRPALLLIGDLAFLHDMNGLIAATLQPSDITIVIMNNNGGGIFSYLPQSGEERHYEALFGTPTGLSFKDAAAMYGAQYDAVQSKEELMAALGKEKTAAVRLIEVFTNRRHNTETHRKLWGKVNGRLDERW
ncbi:2-succinyl-5-enolpyruvyl-6-hydroxy-3-cyclohexene-1-carboxylate synthase [Indiicoccus explosivorum]|uniref:2-succinyl-5-enolpyruvyl-6-hydroxy-3- cyclohexene-1-carboxylate synthase n=1 Tax=Indiicoccus explosivorum TaxID=1917864 RepID=UPI001F4F0F71|nr:thiamine pyrophosphate-dependent enzyme [Indiicoccus explosivorum]